MINDGTFYIGHCPSHWEILSNLMEEVETGTQRCRTVTFALCETQTSGILEKRKACGMLKRMPDEDSEADMEESEESGFFHVKVRITTLGRINDHNNDLWSFVGQIWEDHFRARIEGDFSISNQVGEVEVTECMRRV